MLTDLQFVRCLAQTESLNNPNAPMGDDGRALGRWQVHPDWFDEWRGHFGLAAILDETWDSWIGRIVFAFAHHHLATGTWSPVVLAMYFHLGHWSDPSKADWDTVYAARFAQFEAALIGK